MVRREVGDLVLVPGLGGRDDGAGCRVERRCRVRARVGVGCRGRGEVVRSREGVVAAAAVMVRVVVVVKLVGGCAAGVERFGGGG